MKLSPEVNLLAVAHYLQALEVQRKANQAVAILGSKTPNIQNLAVGGVANAINLDSPAALNMEKLPFALHRIRASIGSPMENRATHVAPRTVRRQERSGEMRSLERLWEFRKSFRPAWR